MTNILHWGAGVFLALHGLVHLMGAASYLKLATVEGLPYKTTVLGGRLNLGESGAGVFGLLWVLAALGFLLAAAAHLFGWAWWLPWWRPALIAVTLLSLALTVLDAGAAKAGIVVNLVILALILLPTLSAHRVK